MFRFPLGARFGAHESVRVVVVEGGHAERKVCRAESSLPKSLREHAPSELWFSPGSRDATQCCAMPWWY